jgi:transposase
MIYVGIDLHRKRSQITALDEQGAELLSRRVANEPEALKAILADLGGELQVALEATYGWEWLADLLEQEGHELHLSHPLRTKAIAAARVKTDAVDARTLAHLLRTDLLPEAYVAPRELRDLRDLLRHRVVLTRMRSALKNRVHALLARQGIQNGHADLFGIGGRRYLSALPLRDPARRRLDSLLSLIGDFDREIELAKREIDALARHDPRVDVLCQLRGIGPYTAMLVIAEVGEIDRFRSSRHLCAWAGLTPTVRSSDGHARLGHISQQGSPHIRWAPAHERAAAPSGSCEYVYRRAMSWAVSAKQRLRLEREDCPGDRRRAAQRGQQRSISRRQLRPWRLAAEDRQLVAEDEDLRLLRATRPP